MPFPQEPCRYHNNVPTIRSRTITFASSARRRAHTPALHPTTLSLILSIASTRFITFSKQSEATSNTKIHPSILILAYLSLLFSMLGALSGALSTGPVVRTRYQDQLAFVGGPGWPTSANVNESHTNACLPDLPFRLSAPLWLMQRTWDCPSVCALASLICFAAQVWLYVCIYEPCSVQVVGGFAAAAALVALRRLRTSPHFIPWTGQHS